MPKVILKGYILVPEADLLAVRNELPNHINLTRNEAGCLVFEVAQDKETVNRFNVYEEFTDKHAFNLHQQRVRDSAWGKITISVERHYEIEEIDVT
jgi:(4S)-4-hydroxy-5-phosphonooxypentane-2,3-dione isomerase